MSDAPTEPSPRANFPHVVHEEHPTASVRGLSGVVTDIGSGEITPRAVRVRYSTDEDMVWQESPSLLLLMPPLIKMAAIFVVLLFAASLAREQLLSLVVSGRAALVQADKGAAADESAATGTESIARALELLSSSKRRLNQAEKNAVARGLAQAVAWVPYGVAVLMLLRWGLSFLRLKMTRYWATSQRLVIESGILRSVNIPFELHRLGNALIVKPLLLRPFGVSNLLIADGIELRGLRNAEYVRDLLRTGGQLEAQRVDKIRWR